MGSGTALSKIPPFKAAHLIICEGIADKEFLGALVAALNRSTDFIVYELRDLTVEGFGGTGQWKPAINSCLATDGVDSLKSITLVADCDDDAVAALKGLQKAVEATGTAFVKGQEIKLIAPAKCRASSGGKVPVFIELIPNASGSGELATLVYGAIQENYQALAACVDTFIECTKPTGLSPGKMAKLKVSVAVSKLCDQDPSTKWHLVWKRSAPVIPIASKAFDGVRDYLASYP